MSDWGIILGTEILGTALLVLIGNGVIANAVLKGTKGYTTSNWLMGAFGWGAAVCVGGFVATMLGGRGQLNPVITIAILVSGNWSEWMDNMNKWMAAIFIAGQIIGAFIGQILCDLIYLKHIKINLGSDEVDREYVLSMHSTNSTVKNPFYSMLIELLITSILAVSILAMTETGKFGEYGTLLVTVVIFAIGVSLGGVTGYALNPVRDLMPRIVHQLLPLKNKVSSNWKYAWVPVVGPMLGGILVGLCFLI